MHHDNNNIYTTSIYTRMRPDEILKSKLHTHREVTLTLKIPILLKLRLSGQKNYEVFSISIIQNLFISVLLLYYTCIVLYHSSFCIITILTVMHNYNYCTFIVPIIYNVIIYKRAIIIITRKTEWAMYLRASYRINHETNLIRHMHYYIG